FRCGKAGSAGPSHRPPGGGAVRRLAPLHCDDAPSGWSCLPPAAYRRSLRYLLSGGTVFCSESPIFSRHTTDPELYLEQTTPRHGDVESVRLTRSRPARARLVPYG